MSKRQVSGLTALAAVLALSGCIGGSGGADGPVGTSPFWLNASAPRAMQADGVTIVGPSGFCIDPGATQASDDVRFALLGSCASLANSATHGKPRKAAVLSASLGPTGGLSVSENSAALTALLSGPQGRALLATDGGGAVTVHETAVDDGVILVHASDPGLTAARQLEPDYWRGFFDLDGRVVTLSVFSLPGRQSLTDKAGQSLLMSFVAAMRQANAEASVPDQVTES